MLKVNVGTNTSRNTVIVDEFTATPREVFEGQGVNYDAMTPILNGIALAPGFLDKTFAELGVEGEKASLYAMAKADNASV